jgi:serine/threonine protein kinase
VNNQQIEEIWAQCLNELEIKGARLHTQSAFEPFRRVYFTENKVYKIEFPAYMTPGLRAQDLIGELEIYNLCRECEGIVETYGVLKGEAFTALILENYTGKPLSVAYLNWKDIFALEIKLARISITLAMRGVAHNDFIPSNILINDSGAIALIDFDQATVSKPLNALFRSFTGISSGENKVHATIFNVLNKKVKSILPAPILALINRIRDVRGKNTIHDAHHQLPDINNDTNECAALFIKAWELAQQSNASSPGRKMAYYSIDYCGYHFPGERPWEERWNILRDLAEYNGKRVLELGCNMSLLSCFLLKFEGAKLAMAVDHDNEILASANLISKAMDVNPTHEQISFDGHDNWESKLESFGPDIVFALNVLNWIKEKKRFLDFLGRFNMLIFEGHDSFDTERKRLEDVGFKSIKLVGLSERNRPLMVCKK